MHLAFGNGNLSICSSNAEQSSMGVGVQFVHLALDILAFEHLVFEHLIGALEHLSV